MKYIFIMSIVMVSVSAFATQRVRGYTRKDGTYVAPHRRTDSDGSKSNNWSTKGNTNPDTGKDGTKSEQ